MRRMRNPPHKNTTLIKTPKKNPTLQGDLYKKNSKDYIRIISPQAHLGSSEC